MNKLTDKNLSLFKEKLQPFKEIKGSLLPVLHLSQDIFGYIPIEAQEIIEDELKISNARIGGVISFYELFHRVPTGKHLIGICTGTSCHIQKSKELLNNLESILGISELGTTKDNLFTIIPVKCLGHCDESPTLRIDDEIYTNLDNLKLKNILNKYKKISS